MRLAALDLGSNSFHLLVADELPGGRIRRVTTEKISLRLGELVASTGELGKDARRRSLGTIAELLNYARNAGAAQAVTVATDALRSASDSQRLRDRIRDEYGLKVTVLSGVQEGALSLRGMAGVLALDHHEKVLGLDLGGGSFEIGYGGRNGAVQVESLPIGVARIANRLPGDPPRLLDRAELHGEVIATLRQAAERLPDAKGARAAGTAGTIRDLGRIGLALAGGRAPVRVRGLVVTRDQLERGYARLVSVPTLERMDLPGLRHRRADLLPAGGIVLLATMEVFAVEQIELCDWGLREGALLDVLGPQQVLGRDVIVPL
jgi:exopolyphosphatase/guanosine-5'-triphosphate,3'-diphosphate pyrophosphatase